MIRDGLSGTYFCGERVLNPDHYETGQPGDDDQCLYMGHDRDMFRWTSQSYKPFRDKPGVSCDWCFGGAHSNGFIMAMCDGSVRAVNFSLDPLVHERLVAIAPMAPPSMWGAWDARSWAFSAGIRTCTRHCPLSCEIAYIYN